MSASTKPPFEFGCPAPAESAAPGFFNRLGSALGARAGQWFPDRQILIRGPGKITAIKISQRAQLAGAGAACALLAALAVTSVGLAVAVAADVRVAGTVGGLRAALAAARAQTAAEQFALLQAESERDEAVAAADRQRDAAIARAQNQRDAAVAAALAARNAAVARADAAAASASAALAALIARTQSTVGQVETVIKSTGLDPDRLAGPVSLPARATMPDADSSTAGLLGPGAPAPPGFVPPLPDAALALPAGLSQNAAARAALLLADLRRLQALGAVLAQMPLTSPTAQVMISSGFGMRADPWTGAPEFHVGIDLPGPVGAPVYATAPGVVTYAGGSTGYGNLITIDHGYGLSTRYSHLYKILVKVGETVTLHEEIGLMGNTGWSTGPHLLYETRVDGQPENPLNFIKVNPYDVQK